MRWTPILIVAISAIVTYSIVRCTADMADDKNILCSTAGQAYQVVANNLVLRPSLNARCAK